MRLEDRFITLSIVYFPNYFKHLLAGICEYFTLSRGSPACIKCVVNVVFRGNFYFKTGLNCKYETYS